MATNLGDRSDKELEQGLAEGEFGGKKALVAILAALTLAFMSLRRLWRK